MISLCTYLLFSVGIIDMYPVPVRDVARREIYITQAGVIQSKSKS